MEWQSTKFAATMEQLRNIELAVIMPYVRTGILLFIGLLATIIVFALLRALYLLVTSFFHPAPGPFLARFTRLWYIYQISRHDWHKTTIKLHRKYGMCGLRANPRPTTSL